MVFVVGMMELSKGENTMEDFIEYAYTYNTIVTKDTTFEEYRIEIEDYVN